MGRRSLQSDRRKLFESVQSGYLGTSGTGGDETRGREMDLVANQDQPAFSTSLPESLDDVPVNDTLWTGTRDESLAQIELGVLTAIFTFTVIGNTTVLAALAARRSKMSRMYYFLLHLCVSDLITAFFTVLPQLGWDATYRFRGGNLACKTVKFGQLLGPYLSSYVLVVTAADRYQAICFPLSNCSWTPTKSKLLISAAWVASLLCCVPQVFIFSYQEISPKVFDCWGTYVEPWGLRAYVTWYGVSVFFVPLVVISFTYVCICRSIWRNLYLKRKSSDAESWKGSRAYRFKGTAQNGTKQDSSFVGPRSHSVRGLSRAKIKTVKITVVVIALYVVCSSPFICVQMWMYWSPDADMADTWTNATVTILMLLNSLNSCVNPWIYLLFNRSLVNALRYQVCRCPDKTGSAGPSGGIVPELTTQNTEANVPFSRQSSRAELTLHKTSVAFSKRPDKASEPPLNKLPRRGVPETIAMSSNEHVIGWSKKRMFGGRKKCSFEGLISS